MQELSQQHYNDDEVIAELVAMVSDISKTRQAIPQVTALYKLTELNRQAKERAQRLWVQPTTSHPRSRGITHDSIQVHSSNLYSTDSRLGVTTPILFVGGASVVFMSSRVCTFIYVCFSSVYYHDSVFYYLCMQLFSIVNIYRINYDNIIIHTGPL